MKTPEKRYSDGDKQNNEFNLLCESLHEWTIKHEDNGADASLLLHALLMTYLQNCKNKGASIELIINVIRDSWKHIRVVGEG